MADVSQHGRRCGCSACVELYQTMRIGRDATPWRPREPETATAEQLRDAYEDALNELQEYVEATRAMRPVKAWNRAVAFLRDCGRSVPL